MIQRTLLRQSRALGSCIKSTPRSSLARPQFQKPALNSFARPAWRGYATEPEATKTEATNAEGKAEDVKTEAKNGEAEDPKKKEMEALIVDLKDKYVRSVAEMRNLQERTKRDMQSAKDFAIQKFAKDLVESVDNFDRALGMVPEEKLKGEISGENNEHLQDLRSLHEGLKMTESILMSTLKKHGLERFDPSVANEKFNPNEHEATFMSPMEGKEENTVFHTQQKGFKLNGRVLRPAKVGVVRNNK